MRLKTWISVGWVAVALAMPAAAFADKSVTAGCSLRPDGSAIDANAVSTLNTLTAPVITTGVVCVAYDTVTGEKLARAGLTLYGNRVNTFAAITIPAGHDVRLGVFGHAMYFDGTMVTTGDPQD